MNDRLLAARLADDVDAAFPALVRAHQDRLYSLALRLTGDRHQAEELAHDVFVRAYRALCGYSPERRSGLALRAWLATIALNAARNEARRVRTSRLDDVADVASIAADPADAATASADRAHLTSALRQLSDAQRAAVVLRHVTGLSYGEIATALERPVGTVKADVHRGVAALRALLEQEAQ